MSVVPKDSALNKAGGEDDNVHIRGQEHGSYFESANLSSSRDNCKSFQMSLMEVHNYMLIKKLDSVLYMSITSLNITKPNYY